MANAKSATLTSRIESGFKGSLRKAAEREHLSIANTMEVMIGDCCGQVGVAIHKRALSEDRRKPTTRKM